MRHRLHFAIAGAIGFALTLSLAGCEVSPEEKSEQLDRVAKDWSLVMRASQVLPTYPLSEDLRPGDAFLTTTPIGEEIALFESKGFLPFDYFIARINVPGLNDLYAKWPSPTDSANWKPLDAAWPGMPLAGFPTYSFSIQEGSGINIALPVKGVPIAFNMLGTATATGTITLRDARTYGVDLSHLDPAVDAWRSANRDIARRLEQWGRLAALSGSEAYLRVVSRVYLVKQVNVQMVDARAAGAGASGGQSRPVDLLTLEQTGGGALDNYKKTFEALDTQINAANALVPGGSLKLVSASSRSVSIDETFGRPLVIGYLAFDYLIRPDGGLMPAVPTLGRIDPSVPSGTVLGAGTQWTEYLRSELRGANGDRLRTSLRAFMDGRGLNQLTIAEFVRDPAYLADQQAFVEQYLSEN